MAWPHYGRFIRLDRGRAIEHTWMSEATRGLEATVAIALTPRDVAPRSRFSTPTCPMTRWGAATRTDGRGISTCWRNH
jgi:hypothetical protein